MLGPDDPRFLETVAYLKKISASQGINTDYAVDGHEVVVTQG